MEEQRIVENDFYKFQTTFRRILKNIAKNPNPTTKKIVFSVRRNLQASPLRQLEYIMEIVPANKVHFYDIEELAQENYAIPAAPDYPEVEQEIDSTKE